MKNTIMQPLPNIQDPLYYPYFNGLKERKIFVQKCNSCGYLQWSPRHFCFKCHTTEINWTEMPHVGTVYTYSVYYRAFHPSFKKDVPYAVVVVDLGYGVRMLGKYDGADIEELECGLQVRAVFDDIDDETTLLSWKRGKEVGLL